MSISAFPHVSPPPSADSVRETLRQAASLWDRLVQALEAQSGQPGMWKSYGPRYGWRLAFARGKGPLAALYPQAGAVVVVVNLVREEPRLAEALKLGPVAKAAFEAAPRLRDGQCLVIPVKSKAALEDALSLVRLKGDARPS
ncbi:MAG: DUF3788 family protein [Acidobacteria bacterium]|nr:DUF3788 family protein [Acidobacteriota bacterium]MBI3486797.1 DUF3788 family protein [Acidobacteriota bacterium]